MSSEWKMKKLDELISINGGFSYKGKFIGSGDSLLLGMGCVSFSETFLDEGARSYSGDCKESYFINPGDIVLATRQQSENLPILGSPAILPKKYTGEKVIVGTNLYQVTNNSEVDNEFLFWLLRSPSYKNHIKSRSKGTTVRMITKDAVESYKFKLPPKEKRKWISDLLWDIQNKIELNRQINETLESMAQAIFRSWFVDFDPVHAKIEATSAGFDPNRAAMAAIAGISSFAKASEDRSSTQDWDEIEAALDQKLARISEAQQQQLYHTAQLFPDELVESEIGEVPNGWHVKPFYDTIKIIGGGTPKTKIDEYWGGEIPWYSVVDAPNESDVFVIDTEKKITKTGLDNSSAKLVDTGTTIISARGTVGKLALTPEPMTYNQSCYGLRSKKDCPYFNFFKTKQLVERLKRGSHGSVFDTITQKTFKTIDIAQPSENLEIRFDEAVDGIMSKIQKNLEGNSTLTLLRETLLPKLISGEVEV